MIPPLLLLWWPNIELCSVSLFLIMGAINTDCSVEKDFSRLNLMLREALGDEMIEEIAVIWLTMQHTGN